MLRASRRGIDGIVDALPLDRIERDWQCIYVVTAQMLELTNSKKLRLSYHLPE